MNDLKKLKSKLLELAGSFKTWVIALSSWLLWHGKISDSVWSTVVIAIALGRTAMEGIAAMKNSTPAGPTDV